MPNAFALLFGNKDDSVDENALDLARSTYNNIITSINQGSVDMGYLLCNTVALVECMIILGIDSFELLSGEAFLLEDSSLTQIK